MRPYTLTNRPKKLELEDLVILCELEHTVRFTKGYYLDARTKLNDFVFQKLGLDPRQVAKSVYGYDNGGSWPFAYTLEDLLKLVNYLLDKEEKK